MEEEKIGTVLRFFPKPMVAAVAIVTSRGGKSSHAAVVARGMGTCCVVGTKALEIDEEAGEKTGFYHPKRAGRTVDGALRPNLEIPDADPVVLAVGPGGSRWRPYAIIAGLVITRVYLIKVGG